MNENFVVAKNNNKNIMINPNGINIILTLDKSSEQDLSLKNLLKSKLRGGVYLENLKIQLILVEDIHIDLVDDLLDFDITRSNLEVILNKNSTLNYQLKICDQPNFDQTDDGLLMAYNEKGYVEKEISFRFVGQNSEAKVRCSCKGSLNRLYKFKTIQDHQAAYTKSDLVVKGAFCQNSKFICDSLIKVSKDAQKVEANQLNKNILLGCHSRAISIPKLEIQADDVKCKHGSAVSKLDEEQLFYLQSRGIDHCTAKNILIDAFLS